MKKLLKWVGILAGVLAGIVAAAVLFAVMTGEKKLYKPDTPYPKLAASTDPEVIARGKYLVHGPAHCAQCHSTSERTKPELIKTTPLQGGLAFEMGPIATTWARNLTPDKETGIGRYTDEELARVLRTSVLPDGNVSFFMNLAAARLSDEDIVAVMSYLRSIEPVKNEVKEGEWHLLGKILLTYAFPALEPLSESPKYVAAAAEPTIERGEYLANYVMLCTSCHTAFDMNTFQYSGPKAGGSLPDVDHGGNTKMEYVAPNLTNHPTGVTGRMDEEVFLARIRTGRVYESTIMPWENFQETSENDLRSVYRYLKALPPVDNDVGPSYREIGSFTKKPAPAS